MLRRESYAKSRGGRGARGTKLLEGEYHHSQWSYETIMIGQLCEMRAN